MTSSWFFLSTLNYDARSTTHQIYTALCVNTPNVCTFRPCLATVSTNSACMRTIVAAVLQRQYSQTELIFWITLVCGAAPNRQMDAIVKRDVDVTNCRFDLFTLHAWIRFFECLLHISYRFDTKKWQAQGIKINKFTK